MNRKYFLVGILLTVLVLISSCAKNGSEEVAVSSRPGSPMPVFNYSPQEIAPGVMLTIDWIDYALAADIVVDQFFVIGTLRNESGSPYKVNPKEAFFSVNGQSVYAGAVHSEKVVAPGFDGKLAWQFDRKKDEFTDVILTIGDAKWAGDFTKLVKPSRPSSSTPPSK